MAEILATEILKDDLALSLAYAVTVTNKRARELGINMQLEKEHANHRQTFHTKTFWRGSP